MVQFKSRVYGIDIEDHCVLALYRQGPGDFPQSRRSSEKFIDMPPKKTIDKKAKKSPSKAVEQATILSKGEASSADGGCVVKIEACKS